MINHDFSIESNKKAFIFTLIRNILNPQTTRVELDKMSIKWR